MLKSLSQAKREYGAQILFVYLCEAHALDSWPLSPNAPRNHRCLQERQAAAEALLQRWPAFAAVVDATYIDKMDNVTTVQNGFWPERFFVVRAGAPVWASVLCEAPPCHLGDDLSNAVSHAFGN